MQRGEKKGGNANESQNREKQETGRKSRGGDGRDGRKDTGGPTVQEAVRMDQQSAVHVHVTGCM